GAATRRGARGATARGRTSEGSGCASRRRTGTAGARSRNSEPRSPSPFSDPRMARPSWRRAGRSATLRAASPGTRSITPGRCRTAAIRQRADHDGIRVAGLRLPPAPRRQARHRLFHGRARRPPSLSRRGSAGLLVPPWGGVAGKRVLITGATRGIGLAAAIELARRGAQPTLVARSEARAADAVSQIQAAAGGATVDVLTADLASQASVR